MIAVVFGDPVDEDGVAVVVNKYGGWEGAEFLFV